MSEPVNRAAWAWELLGADDGVLAHPVSPVFTSRFDAEAWLGESWRGLAQEGVASVRLMLRGAEIAPPLPLRSS